MTKKLFLFYIFLIFFKNANADSNVYFSQSNDNNFLTKEKNQQILKNIELSKKNYRNDYSKLSYFEDFKFDFKTNIGIITGESYQYSFTQDNKKSGETKWNFKNIPTGSMGLKITYKENFIFNLSYLTSITNSKSDMKQYQWLGGYGSDDGNVDYENWTHRLNSKTIVDIYEFDINTQAKIINKLFFKLGYKQDRFDFENQAQDLISSCLPSEITSGTCISRKPRSFSKNFDNINTINYNQRFKIPYLGLSYQDIYFNKISTEIFGSFSNMVKATDHGHYILDSLVVQRTYNNGKYYNAGINIGYKIINNFTASIGYEFSQIPKLKGNSSYNYYNENRLEYIKKDTVISNQNHKFFLIFNYQLPIFK